MFGGSTPKLKVNVLYHFSCSPTSTTFVFIGIPPKLKAVIKIMAIGAVLAWVCGVCGATHEGVQLWENGPLWAKTNIGASSGSGPTEMAS